MDMRYGSSRRVRFRADFIVDESVIVEIKARSRILKGHWAQLLHYMTMSDIEVGLVLNFGPRPVFKRLVKTGAMERKERPRTDHSGHG
jgi:GxxExxY protein